MSATSDSGLNPFLTFRLINSKLRACLFLGFFLSFNQRLEILSFSWTAHWVKEQTGGKLAQAGFSWLALNSPLVLQGVDLSQCRHDHGLSQPLYYQENWPPHAGVFKMSTEGGKKGWAGSVKTDSGLKNCLFIPNHLHHNGTTNTFEFQPRPIPPLFLLPFD